MKRLLRISLDTLLISICPIIMWILLGIIVRKEITNIFSLTYPIQFLSSLFLSIFGVGPNINANKNNKKYVIDSNIILGFIVSLIVTAILVINVDSYITFMSMDSNIYKSFCIYSFILLFFQLVLQIVCQKLYFQGQEKKSNFLTIMFNLVNLILITMSCIFIKNSNCAPSKG